MASLIGKKKVGWSTHSGYASNCDKRAGNPSHYPSSNCYRGPTRKVVIQSIPAQNGGSSSGGNPNPNPNPPSSGSGGSPSGGNNNGNGVSAGTRARCLSVANDYRQKHRDTSNLEWDSNLAAAAQKWANHLLATAPNADKGNPHDRNRGNVGENIAWRMSSGGALPSDSSMCDLANKGWYDEINYYNWNNGNVPMHLKSTQSGKAIGHFTQMVWKASRKVGYGIAVGRVGSGWRSWVVARYSPPGNFNSAWTQNVMPLKSYGKDEKEENDDAEFSEIEDEIGTKFVDELIGKVQ